MSMRLFCTLFVLFVVFFSGAQVSEQKVILFAQSKFKIENQQELKLLETKLRENPYVKVARLDFNTQRSFILVKDLESLTEEQFMSWFEEYADTLKCIQIGVYGVDKIEPYPFKNCEE